MSCKRPPFTRQKTVKRKLKGRLLETKRRPFATALIIRHLQTCHRARSKPTLKAASTSNLKKADSRIPPI